jgi:molecular chaperone GrpE
VPLEGVRTTERTLMQSLERFGIQKITAEGAFFDPEMHEAVMEVDAPDSEPGTVVSVIEDGYMIHGRLLRPAKVVVARRRAEGAADESAGYAHP